MSSVERHLTAYVDTILAGSAVDDAERLAMREEFLAHLGGAVMGALARGLDEQAAVDEAITRFGPAVSIRRTIHRAQLRSALRRAPITLSSRVGRFWAAECLVGAVLIGVALAADGIATAWASMLLFLAYAVLTEAAHLSWWNFVRIRLSPRVPLTRRAARLRIAEIATLVSIGGAATATALLAMPAVALIALAPLLPNGEARYLDLLQQWKLNLAAVVVSAITLITIGVLIRDFKRGSNAGKALVPPFTSRL